MCTLALLRRPDADWPLLMAANRDELAHRPSRAPARHWPDRPQVVAGLDLQAGGTWLGLNDDGLVAAVLNRRGSLGPAPGKRSRGELVLEALDHAGAGPAAEALAALDPGAYRSFNLIIADPVEAFWLRHADDGRITVAPIGPGLHMIDHGDLDDLAGPRIAAFRPRFAAAPAPDPSTGDWIDWMAVLADRSSPTGDPRDAMCIVTDGPYGTRSSSLLAVPRYASEPPVWLYADGPPHRARFVAVPSLRSEPRAS